MKRAYTEIAVRELTRLGILEPGQRRRESDGVLEAVWRISPLGLLVYEYQERLGISFMEALMRVNAMGGNRTH